MEETEAGATEVASDDEQSVIEAITEEIDQLAELANSAQAADDHETIDDDDSILDDMFASPEQVIEESQTPPDASDEVDGMDDVDPTVDKSTSVEGAEEQPSLDPAPTELAQGELTATEHAQSQSTDEELDADFDTVEQVTQIKAEEDELEGLDATFRSFEDVMKQETETVAENPGENADQPDEVGDAAVYEDAADVPADEPTPEVDSTETPTGLAASDGMPIDQIDEMLAEQADTAISGDFETPGEILAAEQDGEQHIMEAPPAPNDDSVKDGMKDAADTITVQTDDAVQPTDPTQPMEGRTIMEAIPLHPTDSADAAATMETDEPTEPSVEGVDDLDFEEESIETAGQDDGDATASTGIIHILSDKLFRFCSMINRPLQGASDGTRKMVGMIGLITIANAALIMLGKMLFG